MPLETPTPTAAFPHDIDRRIDAIGLQLAVIRDLSARDPIARKLITKDEVREFFRDEDEEDRQETALTERLYKRLGIVEQDVSLEELRSDIMSDVVAGFYKSDEDQIYIVSDGESFKLTDELTVAHEFVHALQQLHFDIHGLRDGIEANSDKRRALSGLIEGDAQLSELIYEIQIFEEHEREKVEAERAEIDVSVFRTAPPFMQQLVIFPYSDGPQFVVQLFLQNGDFTGVDQAFERIPESTEQVIHPEKYAANELPVEVGLPDVASALGEGWTEIDRDVMGELFLRSLLIEGVGQNEAASAAAGWGGGAFILLEDSYGRDVFVGSVKWDASGDASEFSNAFVEYRSAVTGERWLVTSDDPPDYAFDEEGEAVYLKSGPRSTVIVFADSFFTARDIAELLAPS